LSSKSDRENNLAMSMLTLLEYEAVSRGEVILRRSGTIDYSEHGMKLIIFELRKVLTGESIRVFRINEVETIVWKTWLNKALKFIKLRVI
jgi:hypothetical protein